MYVECHHHHWFSAYRQVLGIHVLHFSLQSALLFISTYDPSFRSSIMLILGLPLTLLPTILPSIMRFNKLSSRRTCPIQFFFRFTTALARHLSSPIKDSISSFVFLSFQLTFSILLHNHISKAFSLSVTSFFIVHVSQPYSATAYRPHQCLDHPLL